MIIHLIGSMRKFDEDLPILREIANNIYTNGHHIALNWFDGVDRRTQTHSVVEEDLDWDRIVEDNIDLIRRSDAIIVESSRYGYSQGFQVALALQNKKPVLSLYRKSVEEYNWPDKMFISGVSDPLFSSVAYENPQDIKEIIVSFLEANSNTSREIPVRLSKDTAASLETWARQSNMSIPEAIEKLISDKVR